jgi:hypothetical protein
VEERCGNGAQKILAHFFPPLSTIRPQPLSAAKLTRKPAP